MAGLKASVLAMAEAMPDDGKIIACVEVPYFGVNGQEALYDASHGKKILETNSSLEVNSFGGIFMLKVS